MSSSDTSWIYASASGLPWGVELTSPQLGRTTHAVGVDNAQFLRHSWSHVIAMAQDYTDVLTATGMMRKPSSLQILRHCIVHSPPRYLAERRVINCSSMRSDGGSRYDCLSLKQYVFTCLASTSESHESLLHLENNVVQCRLEHANSDKRVCETSAASRELWEQCVVLVAQLTQ